MAAPQPAPPAAPPDDSGPQSDDSRNLHDLAVDAHTDIQKLAVGLAHAGVAPQAVQSLTKMGAILSEVVKVLARGPLEQSAQPGGPPSPGGPSAGGPPPGGPPPGGPPPGPPSPAQRPQPARGDFHAASQGLQSDMAGAAQRRQP